MHLMALGADSGEGCLQSWPTDGPSVETVFGKILKFLENEVSITVNPAAMCGHIPWLCSL